MNSIVNEKPNYHDSINRFNDEMIEIRKTIDKGYFLYFYAYKTKIKIVVDVEAEKAKRSLVNALIIIGVVIIYSIFLFKYPFETIMYTIVGVILLASIVKH